MACFVNAINMIIFISLRIYSCMCLCVVVYSCIR